MQNIFYKFLIHHQSDENYFTSDQVIWDYINLYDKYGLVFIMLQRHNVDTLLTKKMLLDVKKSMEVSFKKDELLKKQINYFLPFLISSIVSVTTHWVKDGKKESKEGFSKDQWSVLLKQVVRSLQIKYLYFAIMIILMQSTSSVLP